MIDSKNMTIEELVEELSCQMVAGDYRPVVKQEILSQFAKFEARVLEYEEGMGNYYAGLEGHKAGKTKREK